MSELTDHIDERVAAIDRQLEDVQIQMERAARESAKAALDPHLRKAYHAIEIALGLPYGELLRTRNKPETIALLKIIGHFPWMVEVASSGYDPVVAAKLMVEAAQPIIEEQAERETKEMLGDKQDDRR